MRQARESIDRLFLSMYSLCNMASQQGVAFGPQTIDAVLFDLDGTLMDTDDQIVEELAIRLQRLGWPALYRSARRLVMMSETPLNGLMTLLDALGLDAPLLGLWNWIQQLKGASEPPAYRLMDGAGALLRELSQRYQLAVVTTRGRDDADAFLAQHSLCEYFDVIVTRESTWRLKPHPDPIREAARRLEVPVDRCLMVGDTTVDVKSARRARAKAAAVLCGFGQRRELERVGADVIVERISDLASVL